MKPVLTDERFTLLEETNLAPTLIWLQPGKTLVAPARIMEVEEEEDASGTLTTFTLADVDNTTTKRTYDGPLVNWLEYREAQDAWFTRPRDQPQASPETMEAFRQAVEAHAEELESEPEDCDASENEAETEEAEHATTA